LRKKRVGEAVCACRAYKFPHRFGGGRCCGIDLIEHVWLENFGSGICANCLMVETDDVPKCQIMEGREKTFYCPAFIDYIGENEIRLLGKYWKTMKL